MECSRLIHIWSKMLQKINGLTVAQTPQPALRQLEARVVVVVGGNATIGVDTDSTCDGVAAHLGELCLGLFSLRQIQAAI